MSLKKNAFGITSLRNIDSEIKHFADNCICYREIKGTEETVKYSFPPNIGRNTFLSSPHLCFIIVFNGDLFVSRDDPLMS